MSRCHPACGRLPGYHPARPPACGRLPGHHACTAVDGLEAILRVEVPVSPPLAAFEAPDP